MARDGERWAYIGVGPLGSPHDASLLFATSRLRNQGLSVNSQVACLQAVALLLEWADDRGVDLDRRVGTCDLLSGLEASDLRAFLRRNRNLDKAKNVASRKLVTPTIGNPTLRSRVHYATEYLTWQAEDVIRRVPARDHARATEMRRRFDTFEKNMLSNLPSSESPERSAAEPEERAAFLEAIRPDSDLNPFHPGLRRRNHALLLLIDRVGLRRGEALALHGEDLILSGPKPSVVVVPRVDSPADSRRLIPRAKTRGRSLPLGAALAEALRDYILNDRSKLPGAKRTPFVFLARSGEPLSLQAVNDMYRLLRGRVPGVAAHMSPHVSRHNSNEDFSDEAKRQGLNEDEEKQLRNYTYGWGKQSTQGEKYNLRRTREKAGQIALRMQGRGSE